MKERIAWIDVSKGIGMLLVILGHTLPLNNRLCAYIYTFHMPLFFFLSGYVFSSKGTFWELIKKKSNSLLLPYVIYMGLGLCVTLLIPLWRTALFDYGWLKDIISGSPENMHNSSIWFLLCLFEVCIVFFFIEKLPDWIGISAVIIIYVMGVASIKLGMPRFPLNLDCVPLALVFYAGGYYARKYSLIEKLIQNGKRLIIALVVMLCISGCSFLINGYVNMHGLQVRNPILYLTSGFSGLAVTILFSQLLIHYVPKLTKGLTWYGQHSLTILCIQSLLIRLYALLAEVLFGTKLEMYKFPMNHAVISFVLVGIIIVPLYCLLVDKIKKSKRG